MVILYRKLNNYDVIKQLNYQLCLLHFHNLAVANLHCRVDCRNNISTRSIRSFDNLFKFNVLLPLVTGELLQKTVDVSSVTCKLYNIKI